MKRCFDLVCSAILLLMTLPLLGLLAIGVLVISGRPILFIQRRAGRGGRPFYMYKFRTMRNAFDETGRLLDDKLRMTWFGQLLRSSSLDELPELINVLQGEMSLVGPRPLLVEYVDRYTEQQRRRLEVLPGITGWAQIQGRNSLTWERKFELDVWYVDHKSILLDLKILVYTILKVLSRDGVSADGHKTMPAFLGYSKAKTHVE